MKQRRCVALAAWLARSLLGAVAGIAGLAGDPESLRHLLLRWRA